MALTASFTLVDSFAEEIGDGTIDLDTHSFVAIPLSSGYTFSAAHNRVDDVTANEVTTNGGARITLTGVTWSQTAGVASFIADDVVWTQSGGTALTIHSFAIADNTPSGDANKPLIGCGLLDITAGGTDVVAPAGGSPANTITLAATGGVFFTSTVNP